MSIPTVLQKIVARKREEVEANKAAWPRTPLAALPPVRDFAAALRGDRVRLIAEVKHASPSRGVLREDFDPVALARTYAENGAACVSVLTDEEFFHGHDWHLIQARANISVPVLRKDFVIDPWQITQSRVLGADCVLLIVAILTDDELRRFLECAAELQMAALVETHTEEELERALRLDAPIIGINNRDLHTFETDLATTERLAPLVRSAGDRLLISESGINTADDVARVAVCGARAVLVGEALVREGDPAAKVRELSGVPLPARAP